MHIQENSFIFATGSHVQLMSLSNRRLARAKTQPFKNNDNKDLIFIFCAGAVKV